MIVSYRPSFHRDIKNITDKRLKTIIEQAVISVKTAKTPKEIPNLKKLKGHKISYRIKVGDYRIGVEIESDIVTFMAFGHRKDIYKIFP